MKEKGNETSVFDIAKMVEKDPEVKELAEVDQRKYGTLTGEELKKVFNI